MTVTFDVALERLIDHEGVLSLDPQDPGNYYRGQLVGTKYGISAASYGGEVDIPTLTLERAAAIYRRDFWNVLGAGVHPAIAFAFFDFAVNSSPATAGFYLQRALRVAADGRIGPVTRDALARADAAILLLRYLGERLQYMTDRRIWPSQGRGWARRIASDLQLAADDVEAAARPQPEPLRA